MPIINFVFRNQMCIVYPLENIYVAHVQGSPISSKAEKKNTENQVLFPRFFLP